MDSTAVFRAALLSPWTFALFAWNGGSCQVVEEALDSRAPDTSYTATVTPNADWAVIVGFTPGVNRESLHSNREERCSQVGAGGSADSAICQTMSPPVTPRPTASTNSTA